ncbi:hypothetical protein CGZ95_10705 [Enemella evansiae]|uniref:ABC transporter substrate-binding protein n=1 Tax=Enemella evansiae TaxID=2016499 RepID=UPI000B960B1E|nr:ABC transporter substrate-binding protein [Enemella evansiae]OYN99723.1 hypothetical protein CGZ95_10705 [Enemella evansiae]
MRIACTVITATALMLVAGCSDRPAEPAPGAAASTPGGLPADLKARGIVAGAELTVPPMTFFEPDGRTPTGVNYELAQAMAESLGTKITFQQYAFEGLQPALKGGKIDIIFDVLNDTRQRQQQLDFVDYVKSGNTLLLPAGNPKQIKDLAGLCGATMSTVRGSVQIAMVEKASTDCTAGGKQTITINQLPSAADARLQVQNGRADAFIGNTPVLLYVAKTAGEGKVFSTAVLEGTGSYYGIGVPKDKPEVRDALVRSLQQTMDDGTYQKVLAKYGLEQIALDKPLVNAATS